MSGLQAHACEFDPRYKKARVAFLVALPHAKCSTLQLADAELVFDAQPPMTFFFFFEHRVRKVLQHKNDNKNAGQSVREKQESLMQAQILAFPGSILCYLRLAVP